MEMMALAFSCTQPTYFKHNMTLLLIVRRLTVQSCHILQWFSADGRW